MKIEALHIGMEVRHPQYGEGRVQGLTLDSAEILFNDGVKILNPGLSELQPATALANLSGLEKPLEDLIRETVDALVDSLSLESADEEVTGLASRWQKGTMILQSANSSLQPKEIPLETLFHKIVMIRNNLRVLEQKLNASTALLDADKVELQQYITRCYGSLTTFNVLFKDKQDQFSTKA